MLYEYRDTISEMKQDKKSNSHFFKIFDRHNHLDNSINMAEEKGKILTDIELKQMKVEKLHLKDEALELLKQYSTSHN